MAFHLACPPVHVVTHGRMSFFCSPHPQPRSLNSLVPRSRPSLGLCSLLPCPALPCLPPLPQGFPPCPLCQEPILVCDPSTCCASVWTAWICSLSRAFISPPSYLACNFLPRGPSLLCGQRSCSGHLVLSPQWPHLFLGPAQPSQLHRTLGATVLYHAVRLMGPGVGTCPIFFLGPLLT